MKVIQYVLILLLFVFVAGYSFASDGAVAPSTESLLATIFGCLFAISEALASINSINSNSVFQLIKSILKKLAGK